MHFVSQVQGFSLFLIGFNLPCRSPQVFVRLSCMRLEVKCSWGEEWFPRGAECVAKTLLTARIGVQHRWVGGSPHLAQPPEAHTHTLVPHMVPYGPPASAFGAKNCNSVYVLHMAPHPPFHILLQKNCTGVYDVFTDDFFKHLPM